MTATTMSSKGSGLTVQTVGAEVSNIGRLDAWNCGL